MALRQDARAVPRLCDFPTFRHLRPEAVRRAQSLVTEIHLPAGHLLCEEGHLGREAFFITRGSAVVIRDGRGIAMLGPGDVVGEGALLGDGRRSATVRVTEPVTALVMNVREFLSLLDLPGVGEQIRHTAALRTIRPTETDPPVAAA